MPERLNAGDSVRFNVNTLAARFPRADATVNSNAPMLVASTEDKGAGMMVTVTRQGVPYGVFGEGELEKVDPDTGLPEAAEPPPEPPDTQVGGGSLAFGPRFPSFLYR